MFNNMKIAAAKMFINQYLEGIGAVQELEFDKTAKTINAIVNLQGETQPVRIQVLGYIIGIDYIAISRFSCDKTWVEVALNRFLANREIKIPDKARSALEMVL